MGATRQLRSDGNTPASRRRRTGVSITVPPAQKRKFRERLLKWYAQHARDLPWRKTSDPYQILVSEIGRDTAGAIRAFAFREDAPILDTNVMRVLHRVFVGNGDAKKQKSSLWNLSAAMIPKGKGYDFNQALMDFGAMVCTARDPYCLLCPMKDFCKTYPFTAR